MKIVIDIPDKVYSYIRQECTVLDDGYDSPINHMVHSILHGVVLPEIHGRLGDLDELEQRISNFIEYDAHMLDEYTLIRERFILDGIKDTRTLVEANNAESEE